MNLRCFYCQTPFTLGRAEILAALQRMDTENMNHYDAHCPRCRRANSISRQRLEMFYPNWREAEVEQESAAPASVEEKTPPMTMMPPAAAIPVEAGSAATPAPKPARKRAGAAKKATPKPAGKAKKPATTKAKTTAKPKSKPAATSSAKGKPASKARKTAAKSRKK